MISVFQIKNVSGMMFPVVIEDDDHKSCCFSNVWDCMEFLKKEIGGLNLLRRIEQLAHNFQYSQSSLTRISKLEGYALFHEYLHMSNLPSKQSRIARKNNILHLKK